MLALLGVELAKGETRTDWLARPLSAAQMAYAAEDVAFLLPLYERLRGELALLGRLEWAAQDSAAVLDVTRLEVPPEAAYRRLRGAGRLNRRQLGVLRALAAWRETEARRRDLPRGFVLRDEPLLQMASRVPVTGEELRRVPALDVQQAARSGGQWLELIRAAFSQDPADLPMVAWRPPNSAPVRDLEGRLREVVRQRAAALALPPELLAPRRALDAVLRSTLADGAPRLPRELEGWRRAVVGEELLQAAAATGTATDVPRPMPQPTPRPEPHPDATVRRDRRLTGVSTACGRRLARHRAVVRPSSVRVWSRICLAKFARRDSWNASIWPKNWRCSAIISSPKRGGRAQRPAGPSWSSCRGRSSGTITTTRTSCSWSSRAGSAWNSAIARWWLEPGEMIVVPRGVEHRPNAPAEVAILLFEPASTLNTGNVTDSRTVAQLDRI